MVPTPLVKDGRLFLWCDDGVVSCLRVATGETVWRERVDGAYYASPVWVDGHLYNVSKKGEVVVAGRRGQVRGPRPHSARRAELRHARGGRWRDVPADQFSPLLAGRPGQRLTGTRGTAFPMASGGIVGLLVATVGGGLSSPSGGCP